MHETGILLHDQNLANDEVVVRYPENISEADVPFFRSHMEFRLYNPGIYELNNSFYFQDGMLVNMAGRHVKEHLPLSGWEKQLEGWPRVRYIFGSMAKLGIGFVWSDDLFCIPVNQFSNANFFHWMTEALSKLLLLKEKFPKGMTVLLP